MGKVLIEDLEVCGAQAKYDVQAKQILSNRYVLAWILKETTEEFTDFSVEEIAGSCIGEKVEISKDSVQPEKIIGDNTESSVSGEGTFTFDIRFHAWSKRKEGRQKLLFDVEAQKDYYPGYQIVTRGIFYGARMISSQVHTEFEPNRYDDIKKVYSVWICMNAPKRVGNAVSKFEMAKRDSKAGNINDRKSYDKLTVIQISLNEEMPDEPKSITRLLNVIFSEKRSADEKKKILAEEFGLDVKNFKRKELDSMCNLGEGIYERGIREGRKEGKEEALIKSVENVRKNLEISIEKACSILEISVKQYHRAKARFQS